MNFQCKRSYEIFSMVNKQWPTSRYIFRKFKSLCNENLQKVLEILKQKQTELNENGISLLKCDSRIRQGSNALEITSEHNFWIEIISKLRCLWNRRRVNQEEKGKKRRIPNILVRESQHGSCITDWLANSNRGQWVEGFGSLSICLSIF